MIARFKAVDQETNLADIRDYSPVNSDYFRSCTLERIWRWWKLVRDSWNVAIARFME